MDAISTQCLSDSGVMIIDLYWCERDLQFLGCSAWIFYDFMGDLLLCSLTNFGQFATSGKFHYCSNSSLFVDRIHFPTDLVGIMSHFCFLFYVLSEDLKQFSMRSTQKEKKPWWSIQHCMHPTAIAQVIVHLHTPNLCLLLLFLKWYIFSSTVKTFFLS